MSNAQATYGLKPYPSQPSLQQYGSRQSNTPPRTPSPTPSEREELSKPAIDFKTVLNPKTYMHKKYIPWALGLTVLLALVALMSIYHKQIVNWLTPISSKLRDLHGGWAIPIGILFIISFPPLFGHEIVAVLCGVVWPLWVAFGIVAAGTFLGEVGNFYAFKSICSARGRKLERDNISYACLAYIVRDGGFLIALVARLSAIPGHFTTAVFSTCGMGIIVFSIAAILSLPKQLITVYLGVIIAQSNTGKETKQSKIISDVVLVVSVVITFAAAWWLYRKMALAKPEVLRERRRARARKDWELGRSDPRYDRSTEHLTANVDPDRDSVFNPNDSEEDGYGGRSGPGYAQTSTTPVSVQPQRWDSHGHAIPILYDPPQDVRVVEGGNRTDWDQREPRASNLQGGRYTSSEQSESLSQQSYTGYPPRQGQDASVQSSSQRSPRIPAQQTTYSPPLVDVPYIHARQASSPPPSDLPYALPVTQEQSLPAHSGPPPQQQPIPASVPRYQLQDGPASRPAPSVMSDAPSYHTFAPPPSLQAGVAPDSGSPIAPRIYPPAQSTNAPAPAPPYPDPLYSAT